MLLSQSKMKNSTSSTLEFTNLSGSSFNENEDGEFTVAMVIALTLNSIVCIVILVANACVLVLLCIRPRLLTSMSNRILLSLTVADFGTGIVMGIHILSQFDKDLAYPRDSLSFVYRVLLDIVTASLELVAINNLCLVIFERYVCLLHPYHVTEIISKRRIRIGVALTWIVSFIVPSIQLIWLHRIFDGVISKKDEEIITKAELAYSAVSVVIFVVIPIFTVSFAFFKMSCAIKQLPSNSSNSKRKADRKVLLVFAAMFLLFIAFCVPYFIVRLLVDLGVFSPIHRQLRNRLLDTVYSIKHVTPLADPFIYTFYKPDFRAECRRASKNFSGVLRSSLSRSQSKSYDQTNSGRSSDGGRLLTITLSEPIASTEF